VGIPGPENEATLWSHRNPYEFHISGEIRTMNEFKFYIHIYKPFFIHRISPQKAAIETAAMT
jgi:hypothetical protein